MLNLDLPTMQRPAGGSTSTPLQLRALKPASVSVLRRAWTVVQALEKKLGKTAATIPPRHRANIAAAAPYFIHASKWLLECSPSELTGYDWEDDGELWKGPKGYSAARWVFWRERWEVLRQDENLSDEEREAARRAEVSMGKAERQQQQKKKKK